MQGEIKLKKTTVRIFKEVINREKTLDEHRLVYAITEALLERYKEGQGEAKLKRIGLYTTEDIKRTLREFIIEYDAYLVGIGLLPPVEEDKNS